MERIERWIKIDEPKVAYKKELVELSAKIYSSDGSFSPFKLWFHYPLAYSKYINKSGDPFLAALLPLAMIQNYQLKVESSVSECLLENTQQIMAILSGWYKPMKQVDVKTDSLRLASFDNDKVGCFFTGGVDSFYTVLKNLKNFSNESRISHLIFVHGFDVHIEKNELYNKISENISSVSQDLELTFLNVKTNLRNLTDGRTRWDKHQHGAALAAVGLSLSKLFKTIFVSSSVTFSNLGNWGSHPVLDPLWSNGSTVFIHDGNEANRFQKIKREIGHSQTALNHLRVCWRNPDNQYNCGKCGKCIRTKLSLKMAGVLGQCKTLDHRIDLEKYAEFLRSSRGEQNMLREIIQFEDTNNSQLKKVLANLLKNNTNNSLRKKRLKSKMKSILSLKKLKRLF